MIRPLLFAILLVVAGATEIPLDRIEGLALEEAVVVLGIGHGYNVTRDGVVTLDDGATLRL